MNRINIPDISHINEAAKEFARAIKTEGAETVAFYGEMGAGKTTFISRLVQELGTDSDQANSPSFSIVNEYDTPQGTIRHFDLYRLDSVSEAIDLGLDEYFYDGGMCLLEWPERVEEILPDDTMRVSLTVGEDGSRTLEW